MTGLPRSSSRGSAYAVATATAATPTKGVVKGALAIYVLPLVMLILGYVIAAAFSLSESVCIAVAFGAAILGIVIAIVLSRARHKLDPTPTKIVSVIEND